MRQAEVKRARRVVYVPLWVHRQARLRESGSASDYQINEAYQTTLPTLGAHQIARANTGRIAEQNRTA
jgi:hypothetical protein